MFLALVGAGLHFGLIIVYSSLVTFGSPLTLISLYMVLFWSRKWCCSAEFGQAPQIPGLPLVSEI